MPRPYGDYGKIVNWQIERIVARRGRRLHRLARERERLDGRGGGQHRSPIRPRHICILFRRFRNFATDVTRPYVRALEARRIPHVLVGGRSFHEREEVIALRNALTAIEWPDDELTVFATLRGPFFALSDDALLAFRQQLDADGNLQIRRLHPMHAVDRDSSRSRPRSRGRRRSGSAARSSTSGATIGPIAETITMLLEAVRAHAGIALWPTGEQALANCSE